MKTESMAKHTDFYVQARRLLNHHDKGDIELATQLRFAEALERIADSMEAGARNERARA